MIIIDVSATKFSIVIGSTRVFCHVIGAQAHAILITGIKLKLFVIG